MAEFEGNLNLNVETSEIEIKGKFKLTEEELDKVAGGCSEDDPYKTCDDNDQLDCGTKNKEVDMLTSDAGTNLIAGVELR